MLSGSDSEDDIPVGRSARKRLLPKSPVSESEESDADETTPLKTSKPADKTSSRSSGRIRDKQNRRFRMPSREEALADIPTPTKKTPEKLSRLTPKKLVVQYSRINTRYNQDDLDPCLSGSDMEDFIIDDNEVESSHSSHQSNSNGSGQSSSEADPQSNSSSSSSSSDHQRRRRKTRLQRTRRNDTTSSSESSSSSDSDEVSDSSSSSHSCCCRHNKCRGSASHQRSRKKGNLRHHHRSHHCSSSSSSSCSSSSSSSSSSAQRKRTRKKKQRDVHPPQTPKKLPAALRNQIEDSSSDSDTIPLDFEDLSAGIPGTSLNSAFHSNIDIVKCEPEEPKSVKIECDSRTIQVDKESRNGSDVGVKEPRRKSLAILSDEDSANKDNIGKASCNKDSVKKANGDKDKTTEKSGACSKTNETATAPTKVGHTSGSDSGINGMSMQQPGAASDSDKDEKVPLLQQVTVDAEICLTRRPSCRAEKMRQKKELSLLRLQMYGFRKQ